MKSAIRIASSAPPGFSTRVGLDVRLEAVALEQVEEREEDRQLEQERPARRKRVDAVLLVEGHHLALHPLAIVLVLLLDLLHLRLELLEGPHRLDLLDGQRQDQQAGEEGEADDRHAPPEADVVVEEEDHRLRRIDQRLEDVRDDDRDHARKTLCSETGS
jgi:hypothetical protein